VTSSDANQHRSFPLQLSRPAVWATAQQFKSIVRFLPVNHIAKPDMRLRLSSIDAIAAAAAAVACVSTRAHASSPTSIFEPHSTPASQLHSLSLFVLAISGLIFVGVTALLLYALVRYRRRPGDMNEPPQVFGSTQIELSWTIIPVLVIVVLFLGTARVLFSVQDAPKPSTALNLVVIGHQFWWEFRYPDYNVVTANEVHIPASSESAPRPTFMKLTSADVIHSFWVPRLAGKTDLLPNRVNEMWMDPQQPGLYVGQCAQFCGTQHAKMLLRVYVDTPDDFARWIADQKKAQQEISPSDHPHVETTAFSHQIPDEVNARNGQLVFEQQACINCHTVAGTVANGRYGPDLTHLMSRVTLAAGAAENTPGNLEAWIADPNTFKPGSLMPAMHLTDRQNAQITAYLATLK
jgi:cytochrome c oxidase subunit 2